MADHTNHTTEQKQTKIKQHFAINRGLQYIYTERERDLPPSPATPAIIRSSCVWCEWEKWQCKYSFYVFFFLLSSILKQVLLCFWGHVGWEQSAGQPACPACMHESGGMTGRQHAASKAAAMENVQTENADRRILQHQCDHHTHITHTQTRFHAEAVVDHLQPQPAV